MTGIGGSYGSWWQSVLTEKMRAGFIAAALELGLTVSLISGGQDRNEPWYHRLESGQGTASNLVQQDNSMR